MGNTNNILLLTGIPRSGTTLFCHLADRLDDLVVSAEPAGIFKGYRPDGTASAAELMQRYCDRERQHIATRKEVRTLHVDGAIPENWMSEQRPGHRRQRQVANGVIPVDKRLGADFLFLLKHPGPFTALLPELKERFPVIAMVRNPLAVLASWNSVPYPVSRGRLPAAEKFDPGLKHALDRFPEAIDRQLYLLSWYFQRYTRHLQPEQVIRYEDFIARPDAVLGRALERDVTVGDRLQARDPLSFYRHIDIPTLARRLLDSDNACWELYRREEVESMLAPQSRTHP